jgi:hypothetical protein
MEENFDETVEEQKTVKCLTTKVKFLFSKLRL